MDGYLSRCTLESIDALFRLGVDDTIKLLLSSSLSIDSDNWQNGGMKIIHPQPGKMLDAHDFEGIYNSYPMQVCMSATFYNIEAGTEYTPADTSGGPTGTNAWQGDAVPDAPQETIPTSPSKANPWQGDVVPDALQETISTSPSKAWHVEGGRWRYTGAAPSADAMLGTTDSPHRFSSAFSPPGAWKVTGGRWRYEGQADSESALTAVQTAGGWQVAGGRWRYEGKAPAAEAAASPAGRWQVAGGRWRYHGGAPTDEGITSASATAGVWHVSCGRWSYGGKASE